jgi:2-polyprenyl-3-methyl-5-hydroxy-6-metoxy-1,4-benzoquinol methylase
MKTPKKELFYNEFSDKWENKINRLETEKRLRVVYGRLLAGIRLKKVKFLDVGCGLGYSSKEASVKGAKVTGIDIGNKLIEKSKIKVPKAKFIVASASKLPFNNDTFDIVLCTEVIEHVNNQKKTIEEILRVLKNGGLLVITSPNRLYRPLFILLNFLKLRPYLGNEKWLYPWEMKKIFRTKKAKILKEVYFNFIYPLRILDYFEKFSLLKYLMINQGYLIKKD